MAKRPEAFIPSINCPYCGGLYAKQGYRNHIAAHEREIEASMPKCEECDRTFNKYHGLAVHRAKMHANVWQEPTLDEHENGLVESYGQEETFPSPKDLGEAVGLTVDLFRPSIGRVEALQYLLYSAFNSRDIGLRREFLLILQSEINTEIAESLAQSQ